ncbi:MAG: hypothetical protein QM537_00740 [Candidatus Symbiobacter sp.]|nr:hypothetical protein [Candidatus Symbiobacter sp.]
MRIKGLEYVAGNLNRIMLFDRDVLPARLGPSTGAKHWGQALGIGLVLEKSTKAGGAGAGANGFRND